MRILIILASGIGNSILFGPTLKQLNEQRPNADIDIYAYQKTFAEPFRGSHLYQEIIYHQGISALWTLRRRDYDVSIVGFPSNRWEFNVFSKLVDADHSIAHSYGQNSMKTLDFLQDHKVPVDDTLHDVQQNLKLLEPLGIEPPDDPDLFFTILSEHRTFADHFLEERNWFNRHLVGIHPGAGPLEWKRAPERYFYQYLEKHTGRNSVVLIFGGAEENRLKREMQSHITNQLGLEAEVVTTSLKRTAALVERCTLFLSNDTALSHIATAMDVPNLIVFFNGTNPTRTRPWKEDAELVKLKNNKMVYPFRSSRPRQLNIKGREEEERKQKQEINHCFFLGTKGQLIKTAPVMREFLRMDIDYSFVHAGMHGKIFDQLLDDFDLPDPDLVLRKHEKDIVSSLHGARWMFSSFVKSLQKVADSNVNFIVHGDASPVLIGLAASLVRSASFTHIEAGLRSFCWSNPFPEEIIRYLAGKAGDTLFAPSHTAVQNLQRINAGGTIVNTGENTVLDSVRLALKQESRFRIPDQDYVVFTAHRYEAIGSRKQMKAILNIAFQIARNIDVQFVLHNTTKHMLEKFSLFYRLRDHPRIEIKPLLVYSDFISLIQQAEFVVTDGGGLQEETYYLGKPCLILRRETERQIGLDSTAELAGFDMEEIEQFIEHYQEYEHSGKLEEDVFPSRCIAKYFDPSSPSRSDRI